MQEIETPAETAILTFTPTRKPAFYFIVQSVIYFGVRTGFEPARLLFCYSRNDMP